jgi:hypothetical protein
MAVLRLLSPRTRCNITFDHCPTGEGLESSSVSLCQLDHFTTSNSEVDDGAHQGQTLLDSTTNGHHCWPMGLRLTLKDIKGNTLNWANLLRKFNKHCPGQNEFAEVVSQTHHLYLQLAASQQNRLLMALNASQTSPLDLGDDAILPEERQQEGQAGYDVLNAIPSPSEVRPTKSHVYFGFNQTIPKSTLLALAYYAYSLSRPSESFDILSKSRI